MCVVQSVLCVYVRVCVSASVVCWTMCVCVYVCVRTCMRTCGRVCMHVAAVRNLKIVGGRAYTFTHLSVQMCAESERMCTCVLCTH